MNWYFAALGGVAFFVLVFVVFPGQLQAVAVTWFVASFLGAAREREKATRDPFDAWATWYGHSRRCSFCGDEIMSGFEQSGRYACWVCSGREVRKRKTAHA